MKKGYILLLISWGMGLVAGVIRAFELAKSFDSYTQLPVFPNFYSVSLIAVTIMFVLPAIWFSGANKEYKPGKTNPPGLPWFVCEIAAAVFLLVSSTHGFLTFQDRPHAVFLIYYILGVMTGLCVFVSAFYTKSGTVTKATGFYYTLPIFWSCFGLVLDYWSHSSNAVKISFIYTMLALCFAALAIHGAAGFFFARPRLRMTMFYSSCGVYFSILTLVSLVIYPLLNDSGAVLKVAAADPGVLFRSGFLVLHLSALLYAICHGSLTKPKEKSEWSDWEPEDFDDIVAEGAGGGAAENAGEEEKSDRG